MIPKVCVVTISHFPYDHRIYYKEVTSLLKFVTSVTIIAQGNLSIDQPNLSIRGISPHSKYLQLRWALPRAVFMAFRENADIYHIHDPILLPFFVIIKYVKRCKIVFDSHEHHPFAIMMLHGKSPFIRNLMRYSIDFVERFFCRFVDFIFVSDDALLKRYSFFNKNVITLFNFPNLEMFEHRVKPLDSQRKDHKTIRLIYSGVMQVEKGSLEMIKIANKLKNKYIDKKVNLVLLGNMDDSERAKIVELVKELGLQKEVDLVGNVPYQDVKNYIYAADIAFSLLHPVPKYCQNVPLKIFEYMACSTPIIASDLPPIRPFMEGVNCGYLVNPFDLDEIVNKISYLIDNPSISETMGENGRIAVETKYNWGKMEKRLLDAYRTLT